MEYRAERDNLEDILGGENPCNDAVQLHMGPVCPSLDATKQEPTLNHGCSVTARRHGGPSAVPGAPSGGGCGQRADCACEG